jgi:hypothetical protein
MVVAHSKAEKDSIKMIEEKKISGGLTNWLSSSISSSVISLGGIMGYSGTS